MSGKNIKKNNAPKVIGIIGTSPGVGVTHFGLMLAVFLTAVKGYRVAMAEQNESVCLRQAEIILKNLKNKKTRRIFNKISIFTQTEELTLSQIISMDFDCVIIDYGCNYEAARTGFLMCHRKLVVGSLSWWKIRSYVTFLINTGNESSGGCWTFLANAPVSEGIHYISRELKIRIIGIPYEPDPFRLGSGSVEFFRKLTDKLF
ncbi:MAG: hypothetical protein ACI4EN_01465 [Butyrivibrio sp.]